MVTRTHSSGSEPTVEDGAAYSKEQAIIGGGKNEQSLVNNLTVVSHRVIAISLSAGTAAKNIGAGGTTPVCLHGIILNAALSGTLTITGLLDDLGAAANHVLPIGFSGSWGLANGAECPTGCTITKSSALDDGKVRVDYRNMA